MHQLPRSLGWPIIAMVDDSNSTGKFRQLLERSWCIALTKAAMRLVHQMHKSELYPVQSAVSLGFVVNTLDAKFHVPQRKADRFQAELQRYMAAPSAAQLASLRGQLAGMLPALLLAPLLGRWLREAAEQSSAADAAELGSSFLRFVADNMSALNGKPWALEHTAAVMLKMVTDASEIGYGAHAVTAMGQWRLAQPFTAAEQARMDAGSFSSTAREVHGYIAALSALAKEQPEAVQGANVQIVSDSSAAVADCERMAGNAAVFPAVRQLHLLAWQLQAMLSFIWQPRDSPELVLADGLSRLPDPTDFAFSQSIAQQQIFGPWGVMPTLDCFGSLNAQMCDTYFAAVNDGHCAAVNGLLQRWDQQPGTPGVKPLCWVFPPPSMLTTALRKICSERAEALVVCPQRLSEQAQHLLEQLPQVQKRSCTAKHAGLVFPTRRVPQAVRAGGWKTPLQVIHVSWDRERE